MAAQLCIRTADASVPSDTAIAHEAESVIEAEDIDSRGGPCSQALDDLVDAKPAAAVPELVGTCGSGEVVAGPLGDHPQRCTSSSLIKPLGHGADRTIAANRQHAIPVDSGPARLLNRVPGTRPFEAIIPALDIPQTCAGLLQLAPEALATLRPGYRVDQKLDGHGWFRSLSGHCGKGLLRRCSAGTMPAPRAAVQTCVSCP